MNRLGVLNKVRGIVSNAELDRIFDEDGVLRSKGQ
jgi:hypothetical protein